MQLSLDLNFGVEGNETPYLGEGWGAAEAGFRWCIGDISELALPGLSSESDWFVELDLHPFTHGSELPAQRLWLLADGRRFAAATLTSPALLGWKIPTEVLAAQGRTRLTLIHPDTKRPVDLGIDDHRSLALAIRSVRLWRGTKSASCGWSNCSPKPCCAASTLEIAPVEILTKFESLGDNCEFGFLQRDCGQETLGLLRFAYIHLSNLIRGLRTEFKGIDGPGNIEIEMDGSEYTIREIEYGIRYHTFLHVGQIAPAELLRQHEARIKFLVRKLLEDVAEANKVFVVRRNESLRLEEVIPLYCTLRSKSRNTLLWVVPAGRVTPPGSVKRVEPGLLQGFLTRLAPWENVNDFLLEEWLQVCKSALESHSRFFEADGQ